MHYQLKLSICLVYLVILIPSNTLFAQTTSEQHLDFETRSYFSSQNYLPFWLWANQKGIIQEQGKYHQTSILKFEGSASNISHKLKLNYGVSLVSDLSAPSTSQINEAFLSVGYKKVFLKIGEQATQTELGGLSATNGDFYYSNNSRPYPSIQFGTNGFLPLFKNVSFSAIYEEALIRDQFEYIKNPNLHHKNLFVRWDNHKSLKVTLGMDDYAWWGGTSPNPAYGKLPYGFSDYLRVIMCRSGGPNAPETERDNAAGNHLGQYKLTIEKEIANQSFLFYLCHPIEDRSGIKWQNYPDNLYGLSWTKKQEQSLISSALLEFYFTRNQNVHPTNSIIPPAGQWPVDYFNHYVYISGYTYKGNVIGVPLFYPVIHDANGKVVGIANTRFYAFHGGFSGNIIPNDHYKVMLTYSVNSGIWNSYPNKLKRLSALFEYNYSLNKKIGINCGLAHDYSNQRKDDKNDYTHPGNTSKQVLGGYFGICWRLIP